MNKLLLKRIGITLGSIIGGIYAIFLLAPFCINPIINNYIPEIKNIIHDTIGLESELSGVKLVTTPKLTAGIKVEKFAISEPNKKEILSANNFSVKMSLIPLLARKIEVDIVKLENADINIVINKDGHFAIEKYIPQDETPKSETEVSTEPFTLPFGFKLSNHLPDIKIGGYNITITDEIEKYTLAGNKTEITDFILNKSIKVKASGKGILKDREQFDFDVKVLNKIMPDIDLNTIVFNPEPQEVQENPTEFEMPDIIGILRGIYSNKLTANAVADLKITNNGIDGNVNLTNLSLLNLPESTAKLKFKGESIDILSNIYTAKNEVSKINGLIKTGNNPNIDLSFNSKVEIANILRIIKEVALIFNIKDLQTLTANGKLDANFNIKSNLKTVKSNGYLTIPAADIYYGLYSIGIDNINADIKLDNNNINIKNIGFSILNQPLKFYGTVTSDAVSDLHLTAKNLSLKGLLVALGQASLLKENQVNSGTISMNADITGKPDKINPVINLNFDNINIKNIPADTALAAPSTAVSITSDGVTFAGTANSSNIEVINPCAKINVPNVNVNIQENEIEITQTPLTIEKIKLNVSGKIQNYLTEKINLNFITSGDIKSKLTGDMNVAKQTLNLNYATTDTSSIIIPMFDKSNMIFNGNINILGSMMNPMLKGSVIIPDLKIPEIPVTMSNLNIKLDGPIVNGNGSLEKFTSGGIEAENITSDFSLKGENFYLTNLKGNAFDGKINGNIIYNLSNAKTNVEFAGSGLDAQKAVYGGVGIKNAITGVLGFDTKLSLLVADYDDMMKSLKGNLKFDIKNGSFGAIGRLDNLLKANNIMTNSILKTTINTIANGTAITETAKFEYLDGNLSFANGWTDIKPIKSSGKSLAYYITGKYNLINGTTNVNILGRLDAGVVAKLGVVGEMSADKLLSYIPKFGNTTANIVKAITADPKSENTSALPALTNGSTNYKDFKVVFNGGLESTSSVKSFKWLTNVDMSAIETKSIKETVSDLKSSINTDYKSTINNVKSTITNSKEQFKTTKEDLNLTKEQLKNSADELKNLFKLK